MPVVVLASPGTSADDYFLTGPDGHVYDLLAVGADVYAAGDFDHIGSRQAVGVARWAGEAAWEPVGQRLPIAAGYDLCLHKGMLHLLAAVDGGSRVWRLEGNIWQPLGGLLQARVLQSFRDELYAGPYCWRDGQRVDVMLTNGDALRLRRRRRSAGGRRAFTTAGGFATGHVAAWDGAAVVPAFAGQTGPTVCEVEEFRGELYAARNACCETTPLVPVWRDGLWQDLLDFGETHYSRTLTLCRQRGRTLVCRHDAPVIIKTFGESWIYRWNGTTSSAIHVAADRVDALLEIASGLLVGGQPSRPLVDPCDNLYLWNGEAALPICPTGARRDRRAQRPLRHARWVVRRGFPARRRRHATGNCARYDGESWSTDGMADIVWDFEPAESRLYGIFSGLQPPSYFMYRDQTGWHGIPHVFPPHDFEDVAAIGPRTFALHQGVLYEFLYDILPIVIAEVSGRISEITTIAGMLVAGGDFDAIGGVAARNIALYDGSVGQPLDGGLAGAVVKVGAWRGLPVAVYEVAGIDRVATWDGSAWRDIATADWSYGVSAIQDFAGDLYLGGRFETIDGQPISHLLAGTCAVASGRRIRRPGHDPSAVEARERLGSRW